MIVYSKRDILKHMPDVQKYDENITSLHEQWDNLKLLCEINCPVHAQSILPAMGNIQGSFADLQQKLIDTLISEAMNQMEQKSVSKAQVAIDILIRNLYERTADVGFLATDGDIRRFVKEGADSEENRAAIVNRLRAYVAKYSVYEEIVLLDLDGRVLANLDESSPLQAGQVLNDPVVTQTINSAEPFLESFGPSAVQPGNSNAHIFSSKILDELSGEAIGVLCLCFRFCNEMDLIFQKLCTEYDGSVLTIVDEKNTVLVSSDLAHVMPGTRVEVFGGETYGIAYYCGREYIVRTVETQGYQGYFGLGWKGHIMLPLALVFQKQAKLTGIDKTTLESLMAKSHSFSSELSDIIQQTQTINRSLKWIVYNGQILAREDEVGDESARLKPILSSIGKMGERTGILFQSSVQNLFSTLVSTSLADVGFLASLCVDIMDRNLYERANDCRWWALNPTFRRLMAQPERTPKDCRRLTQILAYIHSLYTVYRNLFLFDASGVITAVSNPNYESLIGQRLEADYIRGVLNNSNEAKYFVSPFEATGLYDGSHTYVYSASITDPANERRMVGGVGIVFDGTDQFQAMLEDSIKMKRDSFAVFTDRKGRIISSTDRTLQIGTRLNVPSGLFATKNGEAQSVVLPYEGYYYAVGSGCSLGYREYKNTDGYSNDVLAFVFQRLTDVEATDQHQEIIPAVEQSEITLNIHAPYRRLITFVVNGQLFGVDQQVAAEVLDAEHTVSIPGAVGNVCKAVPYQNRYIGVLELGQAFRRGAARRENPFLIVLSLPNGGQLALEVDELNSVLEVNCSDIKTLPLSGGPGSCIEGVACFSGTGSTRYLMVLNHEILLSRQEIDSLAFDLESIHQAYQR